MGFEHMSAKKLRRAQSSARGVSTVESLESRTLLANTPGSIIGGVDPYNMGKGDWIWQISAAEANTGTTTVQGLVDYMKARGFKWVIVKAGDGNSGPVTGTWGQFNTDLVNRFHAAGIKIFGYQFVYGGYTANSKGAATTVSGEKKVTDEIMSKNPDGLIFDAEGEWEKITNPNTLAESYGKNFKTKYPDKLLGHAPFAYAHLHTAFPYQGFGKYADVVMPQMYWKTISIAQTPEKILADVDTDWKALYNGFATSGHSDSIKPIVPIGQGYDPSASNPTPGAEITRFFSDLRDDADPASPFGYNGVGFWSVQHHTQDHWAAIGQGTIGAPSGTISGSIYNDVNGNGIRDLNETGVSGRIVYDDTNDDGKRELYEPFAKTDSHGNFKLLSMAGNRLHHVRQDLPGGWRQTSPRNNLSASIFMSNGQQASGFTFGATQTSLVGGTCFQDVNADGNKQSSEAGIAGLTIFADANDNGVLDAGESSTITDGAGKYSLTLAAGHCVVREIPPAGQRITTPAKSFYEFDLGAGEQTIKFFGNTTNILISGSLFDDKNGDGIKESGEGALSGWTVFIDSDGDGVFDPAEPNVLTDSTGKYRFRSLGAGNWRVAVFVKAGWTPTIPGSAARKIKLAGGGTTSNKNFGLTQIT